MSAPWVQIRHPRDTLGADVALRARLLPEATAQGLNWTGARVRRAEIDEMKRVFDRPTRWTLNAPIYRQATPQRPTVVIELQDDATGGVNPASYLTPQILGGSRRPKRFEQLLNQAGVLPTNWFAIPGNGARMDRHGNMRPQQIVEVLSALRAFNLSGSDMNRTSRSVRRRQNTKRRLKDYFASTPNDVRRANNAGRLPYGIYERQRSGKIVTVLRFRPRVAYRARFDWYGVAERTIQKWKDRHVGAALKRAINEARRAA